MTVAKEIRKIRGPGRRRKQHKKRLEDDLESLAPDNVTVLDEPDAQTDVDYVMRNYMSQLPDTLSDSMPVEE